MRYFVFYLCAEFGKGSSRIFGYKHGIVAESLVTTFLCGNLASNNPLKHMFFTILYQRDGGAKLCRAIILILEFSKEFLRICLGVVTIRESITCRMYSRTSAKSTNF